MRSNEHQGIGFLSDPRRLNVALTRAKYGVIIIGNARILAKDQLWHSLISHYQGMDCLVEGSVGKFSPSTLRLPEPRKVS